MPIVWHSGRYLGPGFVLPLEGNFTGYRLRRAIFRAEGFENLGGEVETERWLQLISWSVVFLANAEIVGKKRIRRRCVTECSIVTILISPPGAIALHMICNISFSAQFSFTKIFKCCWALHSCVSDTGWLTVVTSAIYRFWWLWFCGVDFDGWELEMLFEGVYCRTGLTMKAKRIAAFLIQLIELGAIGEKIHKTGLVQWSLYYLLSFWWKDLCIVFQKQVYLQLKTLSRKWSWGL